MMTYNLYLTLCIYVILFVHQAAGDAMYIFISDQYNSGIHCIPACTSYVSAQEVVFTGLSHADSYAQHSLPQHVTVLVDADSSTSITTASTTSSLLLSRFLSTLNQTVSMNYLCSHHTLFHWLAVHVAPIARGHTAQIWGSNTAGMGSTCASTSYMVYNTSTIPSNYPLWASGYISAAATAASSAPGGWRGPLAATLLAGSTSVAEISAAAAQELELWTGQLSPLFAGAVGALAPPGTCEMRWSAQSFPSVRIHRGSADWAAFAATTFSQGYSPLAAGKAIAAAIGLPATAFATELNSIAVPTGCVPSAGQLPSTADYGTAAFITSTSGMSAAGIAATASILSAQPDAYSAAGFPVLGYSGNWSGSPAPLPAVASQAARGHPNLPGAPPAAEWPARGAALPSAGALGQAMQTHPHSLCADAIGAAIVGEEAQLSASTTAPASPGQPAALAVSWIGFTWTQTSTTSLGASDPMLVIMPQMVPGLGGTPQQWALVANTGSSLAVWGTASVCVAASVFVGSGTSTAMGGVFDVAGPGAVLALSASIVQPSAAVLGGAANIRDGGVGIATSTLLQAGSGPASAGSVVHVAGPGSAWLSRNNTLLGSGALSSAAAGGVLACMDGARCTARDDALVAGTALRGGLLAAGRLDPAAAASAGTRSADSAAPSNLTTARLALNSAGAAELGGAVYITNASQWWDTSSSIWAVQATEGAGVSVDAQGAAYLVGTVFDSVSATLAGGAVAARGVSTQLVLDRAAIYRATCTGMSCVGGGIAVLAGAQAAMLDGLVNTATAGNNSAQIGAQAGGFPGTRDAARALVELDDSAGGGCIAVMSAGGPTSAVPYPGLDATANTSLFLAGTVLSTCITNGIAGGVLAAGPGAVATLAHVQLSSGVAGRAGGGIGALAGGHVQLVGAATITQSVAMWRGGAGVVGAGPPPTTKLSSRVTDVHWPGPAQVAPVALPWPNSKLSASAAGTAYAGGAAADAVAPSAVTALPTCGLCMLAAQAASVVNAMPANCGDSWGLDTCVMAAQPFNSMGSPGHTDSETATLATTGSWASAQAVPVLLAPLAMGNTAGEAGGAFALYGHANTAGAALTARGDVCLPPATLQAWRSAVITAASTGASIAELLHPSMPSGVEPRAAALALPSALLSELRTVHRVRAAGAGVQAVPLSADGYLAGPAALTLRSHAAMTDGGAIAGMGAGVVLHGANIRIHAATAGTNTWDSNFKDLSGSGGGIALHRGATLNVHSLSIQSVSATRFGGALALDSAAGGAPETFIHGLDVTEAQSTEDGGGISLLFPQTFAGQSSAAAASAASERDADSAYVDFIFDSQAGAADRLSSSALSPGGQQWNRQFPVGTSTTLACPAAFAMGHLLWGIAAAAQTAAASAQYWPLATTVRWRERRALLGYAEATGLLMDASMDGVLSRWVVRSCQVSSGHGGCVYAGRVGSVSTSTRVPLFQISSALLSPAEHAALSAGGLLAPAIAGMSVPQLDTVDIPGYLPAWWDVLDVIAQAQRTGTAHPALFNRTGLSELMSSPEYELGSPESDALYKLPLQPRLAAMSAGWRLAHQLLGWPDLPRLDFSRVDLQPGAPGPDGDLLQRLYAPASPRWFVPALQVSTGSSSHDGGCVMLDGLDMKLRGVVVANCAASSSAAGRGGGGLAVLDLAAPRLSDFTTSTAAKHVLSHSLCANSVSPLRDGVGGGVLIGSGRVARVWRAIVTACALTHTQGSVGGGMYVGHQEMLTAESIFSSNVASSHGGGLVSGISLKMDGTKLSSGDSVETIVVANIFAYNRAYQLGGGFYFYGGAGGMFVRVAVTASGFVGNQVISPVGSSGAFGCRNTKEAWALTTQRMYPDIRGAVLGHSFFGGNEAVHGIGAVTAVSESCTNVWLYSSMLVKNRVRCAPELFGTQLGCVGSGGAAASLTKDGLLRLNGNTTFIENGVVTVSEQVCFENNYLATACNPSPSSGGAIAMYRAPLTITVHYHDTVAFIGNFASSTGGAIAATLDLAVLRLEGPGRVLFMGNVATKGAAMHLYQQAVGFISDGTRVEFVRNYVRAPELPRLKLQLNGTTAQWSRQLTETCVECEGAGLLLGFGATMTVTDSSLMFKSNAAPQSGSTGSGLMLDDASFMSLSRSALVLHDNVGQASSGLHLVAASELALSNSALLSGGHSLQSPAAYISSSKLQCTNSRVAMVDLRSESPVITASVSDVAFEQTLGWAPGLSSSSAWMPDAALRSCATWQLGVCEDTLRLASIYPGASLLLENITAAAPVLDIESRGTLQLSSAAVANGVRNSSMFVASGVVTYEQGSGAGVVRVQAGGTLNVSSLLLQRNVALGPATGAGLQCSGVCWVHNAHALNNSVPCGVGGAMAGLPGSTLQLRNVEMTGNLAGWAGGALLADDALLHMQDVALQENVAGTAWAHGWPLDDMAQFVPQGLAAVAAAHSSNGTHVTYGSTAGACAVVTEAEQAELDLASHSGGGAALLYASAAISATRLVLRNNVVLGGAGGGLRISQPQQTSAQLGGLVALGNAAVAHPMGTVGASPLAEQLVPHLRTAAIRGGAIELSGLQQLLIAAAAEVHTMMAGLGSQLPGVPAAADARWQQAVRDALAQARSVSLSSQPTEQAIAQQEAAALPDSPAAVGALLVGNKVVNLLAPASFAGPGLLPAGGGAWAWNSSAAALCPTAKRGAAQPWHALNASGALHRSDAAPLSPFAQLASMQSGQAGSAMANAWGLHADAGAWLAGQQQQSALLADACYVALVGNYLEDTTAVARSVDPTAARNVQGGGAAIWRSTADAANLLVTGNTAESIAGWALVGSSEAIPVAESLPLSQWWDTRVTGNAAACSTGGISIQPAPGDALGAGSPVNLVRLLNGSRVSGNAAQQADAVELRCSGESSAVLTEGGQNMCAQSQTAPVYVQPTLRWEHSAGQWQLVQSSNATAASLCCGSFDVPCPTLQRALSASTSAVDVLLLPGVYLGDAAVLPETSVAQVSLRAVHADTRVPVWAASPGATEISRWACGPAAQAAAKTISPQAYSSDAAPATLLECPVGVVSDVGASPGLQVQANLSRPATDFSTTESWALAQLAGHGPVDAVPPVLFVMPDSAGSLSGAGVSELLLEGVDVLVLATSQPSADPVLACDGVEDQLATLRTVRSSIWGARAGLTLAGSTALHPALAFSPSACSVRAPLATHAGVAVCSTIRARHCQFTSTASQFLSSETRLIVTDALPAVPITASVLCTSCTASLHASIISDVASSGGHGAAIAAVHALGVSIQHSMVSYAESTGSGAGLLAYASSAELSAATFQACVGNHTAELRSPALPARGGGAVAGVDGSVITVSPPAGWAGGSLATVDLQDSRAGIGGALLAHAAQVLVTPGAQLRVQRSNSSATGGGVQLQQTSSLTIQAGAAMHVSRCRAETAGAGVYARRAAITAAAPVYLTRNIAQEEGGGLSMTFADADITGAMITGNSAARGGGLQSVSSSLLLRDSQVQDNTAVSFGGGVELLATGTADVQDCVLENNVASEGGGVYLSTATMLAMSGTVLQANRAVGSHGGGLRADLSLPGQVAITGSTFMNNSATAAGGSLALSGLRQLDAESAVYAQLVASQVYSSHAVHGAGIAVQSVKIRLEDVLVAGNIAEQAGGGIAASAGAELTMLRGTVSECTAALHGSAISIQGNASIATLIAVTCASNAAGAAQPLRAAWPAAWSALPTDAAGMASFPLPRDTPGGTLYVDSCSGASLALDSVEVRENAGGGLLDQGLQAGLQCTPGSVSSTGTRWADNRWWFGTGVAGTRWSFHAADVIQFGAASAAAQTAPSTATLLHGAEQLVIAQGTSAMQPGIAAPAQAALRLQLQPAHGGLGMVPPTRWSGSWRPISAAFEWPTVVLESAVDGVTAQGVVSAAYNAALGMAMLPGLTLRVSVHTVIVRATVSIPGEGSLSTLAEIPLASCSAGAGLQNGACSPCLPGTAAPEPSLAACTDCAPGAYSTAGAKFCQPCPPGHVGTLPGQDVCDPCLPGTFSAVRVADARQFGALTVSQVPADAMQAAEQAGLPTSCVACPLVGVTCASGLIQAESGWYFSSVYGGGNAATAGSTRLLQESSVNDTWQISYADQQRITLWTQVQGQVPQQCAADLCQVTDDGRRVQCAVGQTGPLCGACASGWVRGIDACVECPGEAAVTLGVIGVALMYLASIVYSSILNEAEELSARRIIFRQAMNYAQLLAGMGELRLDGQEFVSSIFAGGSTASVDPTKIPWVSCALGGAYYALYAIRLTLPIIFCITGVIVQLCTIGMFEYKRRRARGRGTFDRARAGTTVAAVQNPLRDAGGGGSSSGKQLEAEAEKPASGRTAELGSPVSKPRALLAAVKRVFTVPHDLRYWDTWYSHRLWAAPVVLFLYSAYPTLMNAALEVFSCSATLYGHRWLSADLSIPCNGSQYDAVRSVGYVVLVCGVAAPMALAWNMRRLKHRLSQPDVAAVWGFVMGGYRPEAYYFESWLLLRKLALSMAAFTIALPGAQVAACLIVVGISLGVQLQLRPLVGTTFNYLEASALSAIIITLFTSLAVYLREFLLTSPGEELDAAQAKTFSTGLSIISGLAHVAVIGAFAWFLARPPRMQAKA